jgi:hypothetical protein
MTEEWDNSDEFINSYRAHLTEIDEIAQVILKGHLDVEMHLDDALRTICFHPEHLEENRLSFAQKVNVVRAYALNRSDRMEWNVIRKLNEVRNQIAHRGQEGRRTEKITELRNFLASWGAPNFGQNVQRVDEKEVVILAAVVCGGFLITTEDQITEMRGFIESAVLDHQTRQLEGTCTEPPQ